MATKTPPRRRQSNPPYDWLDTGIRPFHGNPNRLAPPRRRPDGNYDIVEIPTGTEHGWQGPLPFPTVDLLSDHPSSPWRTFRADSPQARRPWEYGLVTPETDEHLRVLVAELRALGQRPCYILSSRLAWERRSPASLLTFNRWLSYLDAEPLWLFHPMAPVFLERAMRQLRASSGLRLGAGPHDVADVTNTPDKTAAEEQMQDVVNVLSRKEDAGALTARLMEALHIQTWVRKKAESLDRHGRPVGMRKAYAEAVGQFGRKSVAALKKELERVREKQDAEPDVPFFNVQFPPRRPGPLKRPPRK